MQARLYDMAGVAPPKPRAKPKRSAFLHRLRHHPAFQKRPQKRAWIPLMKTPKRFPAPSFLIPDAAFVPQLQGPLVEIAAGSGAISAILQQAGVDIIATDPYPIKMHAGYDLEAADRRAGHLKRPKKRRFAKTLRPWIGRHRGLSYTTIERLDAQQAMERYPDRHVLCLFPDPAEDAWVWPMLDALGVGKILYLCLDYCPRAQSLSWPEGIKQLDRLMISTWNGKQQYPVFVLRKEKVCGTSQAP